MLHWVRTIRFPEEPFSYGLSHELFPIFLLPRSIRWQPSYHSQDLKSAANLGYFGRTRLLAFLSRTDSVHMY